jgi:hypothetical protein
MLSRPRLATIVALVLIATGGSAWSQVLGSRPTAQLKGAATLFQLRIPFGGREQEGVRPTFTFNAGPLFQEQNDASYLRGTYFTTPSVQAGVSLDGDPVLKVGSRDLIEKRKTDRAHLQEETLIGFLHR